MGTAGAIGLVPVNAAVVLRGMEAYVITWCTHCGSTYVGCHITVEWGDSGLEWHMIRVSGCRCDGAEADVCIDIHWPVVPYGLL